MGRRWLAVACCLVVAGFIGVAGSILWELRRQTWDNATDAAENLLAAVSQDIGRNVEVFDLSLQAVVDGLSLSGLQALGPELRRAVLFDRAASAEYLGSILVLDAGGEVVEDAGATPPRRDNLADRSYFTVHRDRADVGLFISEPFRRRLTGPDDWVIAFSRRITNPDGSFGGVVSSTLRLGYFGNLFSRFRLGEQGATSLTRSDGVLLMRTPFDEGMLGRNLAQTPVMQKLLATPAGRVVVTSPLDNVERAVTFAHVPRLPLVLTVAQSPRDILRAWTRYAVEIGIVLLSMCVVLCVLALACGRELRRRTLAEAETRRSGEQLRLITDHVRDVIIHLDPDLVRTYVSPSCLALSGFRQPELVGRDFRALLHPDDGPHVLRAIEEARTSRGHSSAIYRIVRKDGRPVWVESHYAFMASDGGFSVVLRDIQQRKSAEEALSETIDELERMAATDGLTGLSNRRRFDQAAIDEWRRAAREERPLSLLLLDVDHFKRFNDAYGHQEGDACLRAVARAIARCARRPADLVARYGGEEFAVLLPDTERESAAEVGERIRKAVQHLRIPHEANGLHGAVVTVSVGVQAVMPRPRTDPRLCQDDLDDAVGACDRALYQAKEAGRNRVVTAPTRTPSVQAGATTAVDHG